MTVLGVKKELKKYNKLDEYDSDSLKAEYIKTNLKLKSKLVLDKIKKLKNYGKKTHIKVRLVPESPDSKFIYYAKEAY